jgi:hypothetical protein
VHVAFSAVRSRTGRERTGVASASRPASGERETV